MKYTAHNLKRYREYLKFYEDRMLGGVGLDPENDYDFEQEQRLVDKCKAGYTLFILQPTPRESE
jgi:hypothetical protein